MDIGLSHKRNKQFKAQQNVKIIDFLHFRFSS